MIRVLIVDDHGLVRAGVTRLLTDVPNIKIIGEAADGAEAIRLSKELEPDVVLLDIRMPGMSGLSVTRKLIRYLPDVKILVFTAYSEDPFPSRMIRSGAFGYLAKTATQEELIRAIKSVYAGQRYLNSALATSILLNPSDNSDKTPFDLLSSREQQVMYLIIHGFRVPEIAERLKVTSKTINSYRYRMFEKLNVESDVTLLHLAIRYDLLKMDLPEGLDLIPEN